MGYIILMVRGIPFFIMEEYSILKRATSFVMIVLSAYPVCTNGFDNNDPHDGFMLGSRSLLGVYNRSEWGFNSAVSPVSDSLTGWYTGISEDATDVDHVVALKDAYISGGYSWTKQQKQSFSNDPSNHVSAVPAVNRALKRALTPYEFIMAMNKSEYAFLDGRCLEYVERYIYVKNKYGLTHDNDDVYSAKLACW